MRYSCNVYFSNCLAKLNFISSKPISKGEENGDYMVCIYDWEHVRTL